MRCHGLKTMKILQQAMMMRKRAHALAAVIAQIGSYIAPDGWNIQVLEPSARNIASLHKYVVKKEMKIAHAFLTGWEMVTFKGKCPIEIDENHVHWTVTAKNAGRRASEMTLLLSHETYGVDKGWVIVQKAS